MPDPSTQNLAEELVILGQVSFSDTTIILTTKSGLPVSFPSPNLKPADILALNGQKVLCQLFEGRKFKFQKISEDTDLKIEEKVATDVTMSTSADV